MAAIHDPTSKLTSSSASTASTPTASVGVSDMQKQMEELRAALKASEAARQKAEEDKEAAKKLKDEAYSKISLGLVKYMALNGQYNKLADDSAAERKKNDEMFATALADQIKRDEENAALRTRNEELVAEITKLRAPNRLSLARVSSIKYGSKNFKGTISALPSLPTQAVDEPKTPKTPVKDSGAVNSAALNGSPSIPALTASPTITAYATAATNAATNPPSPPKLTMPPTAAVPPTSAITTAVTSTITDVKTAGDTLGITDTTISDTATDPEAEFTALLKTVLNEVACLESASNSAAASAASGDPTQLDLEDLMQKLLLLQPMIAKYKTQRKVLARMGDCDKISADIEALYKIAGCGYLPPTPMKANAPSPNYSNGVSPSTSSPIKAANITIIQKLSDIIKEVNGLVSSKAKYSQFQTTVADLTADKAAGTLGMVYLRKKLRMQEKEHARVLRTRAHEIQEKMGIEKDAINLLTAKLKESEEEHTQTKAKLSTKVARIAELEKTLATSEDQKRADDDAMSSLRSTNKRLEEDKRSLATQNAELKEKILRHADEMTDLKNASEEAVLAEKEKVIASANELAEARTQHLKLVESLRSDLKQAKQLQRNAESALATEKETLSAANASLAEEHSQYKSEKTKEIKLEQEKARKAMEKLSTSQVEWHSEKGALQSELETVRKKLDAAQQELSKLNAASSTEIAALKASHAAEISALQKSVEKKQAECDAINQKLTEKTSLEKTLQQKIQSLTAENATLKAANKAIDPNEELTKELAAQKAALVAKIREFENLKNQNVELENQLAEQTSRAEAAESEKIADKKQHNAKILAMNAVNADKINDLNASMQTLRQEVDKLKENERVALLARDKAIADLEAYKKAMGEQLIKETARLSAAESRIKDLIAEKSAQALELKTSNEEIALLKSQAKLAKAATAASTAASLLPPVASVLIKPSTVVDNKSIEEIAKLKKQVSELKMTILTLNEKVSSLKTETLSRLEKIGTLEQTLRLTKNEAQQQLKTRFAKLETELVSMHQRLSASEKETNQLRIQAISSPLILSGGHMGVGHMVAASATNPFPTVSPASSGSAATVAASAVTLAHSI